MRRSRILVAVAVGISLLTPFAAMAASAPKERPELMFKGLTAIGSGCPGGTARPVMAEMQPTGALTVEYGNFVVSGGDYRTCTVAVSLAATPGWTYLIPSLENRAWVELDAGGTARIATAMWLTGFPWTMKDDKRIAGPLNNYWGTNAAPEQPMWAPCGESLNLVIAETVRVAATSSNTANLVTTTLAAPTWRQC